MCEKETLVNYKNKSPYFDKYRKYEKGKKMPLLGNPLIDAVFRTHPLLYHKYGSIMGLISYE